MVAMVVGDSFPLGLAERAVTLACAVSFLSVRLMILSCPLR